MKCLTSLQYKTIIAEEREWREELDRDLKVLRKEYENKNNQVCFCFRTILSGVFETVTPDGVLNDQVSESTSSFLLQLREIQKEAESKTSADVSAPAEEEEEDS